jgi:DNA-binding GntR family transcriptional regulator
MANINLLQTKSLREQVYDYLRSELNRGGLRPGAFLDLKELEDRLRISRTPLRDALIQLEVEGFVTILPRRGIRVNALTLDDVRRIYEIVGALEASAVASATRHATADDVSRLRELNEGMARAIAADDFDHYYEHNLAFHDAFLERADNPRLARLVRILKQRLYDWPRRKGYVKAWEEHSIGEHAELIRLIEEGNAEGAAAHMRDVHWSFAVQEPFIRQYYFARVTAGTEE